MLLENIAWAHHYKLEKVYESNEEKTAELRIYSSLKLDTEVLLLIRLLHICQLVKSRKTEIYQEDSRSGRNGFWIDVLYPHCGVKLTNPSEIINYRWGNLG